MRGFLNKGNAARLVFLSQLMGLLLLAGGTVFAQSTITTVASTNANAKFDGVGMAVNANGDVFTTGSTPVPDGMVTKWIPAVLKLSASGSPQLVEGSKSDPNPQYGVGVCGYYSAMDIDPTDMGGVAVDNSGTLYSAMAGGAPPVLRISGGNVSCPGWNPNSGPQSAVAVASDNSGNVYFIAPATVGYNFFVYKMNAPGTGAATQIAATANPGCTTRPYGLAVDNRTGNLYIADAGCNVIWQLTPAGSISRYAGNMNFLPNPDPTSLTNDGIAATEAYLNQPRGVAVDVYGNVYIADFADQRIRKVDSTGTITTIAGTGVANYKGDNGDPTKAELNGPWSIAVGPGGKIYVGDSANNVVRLITPAGAQMISPAPGTTIGELVTFSWTAVSGATSYQLEISQGAITGGQAGTTAGTSAQATIPCDGKTIYVQLSTEIGGAWTAPVPYIYTACQPTLSIALNPSTLSQQGGPVTVEVLVDTAVLAPWESVELTVTQYRPLPPNVYCFRGGCPVPVVIGTGWLPQEPYPLPLSLQVNIPAVTFFNHQPYTFTATLTSTSGEVLATASAILTQH